MNVLRRGPLCMGSIEVADPPAPWVATVRYPPIRRRPWVDLDDTEPLDVTYWHLRWWVGPAADLDDVMRARGHGYVGFVDGEPWIRIPVYVPESPAKRGGNASSADRAKGTRR